MSATPPVPAPPEDQDARTQRHLAFLDTLIAHGMDLATRLHQQSTTPSDLCSALAAPGDAVPFITPEVIASFAQINQTVRRAILLSQKLAEPLPLAPTKPAPSRSDDGRSDDGRSDDGRSDDGRIAARKRIIREVEDTIHREARAPGADALRAELHERVESGDLDDEIGNRPVHEIIAEICRDLGVTSAWEQARFKRRTPEDLQALNARAARPSPGDDTKAGVIALHASTKPEPRPPKHPPS